MHTVTLVLLPADIKNVKQACANLLEPHRLDWDNPDRPSRLDYWTTSGEHIADVHTAAAIGVADDPSFVRNVCLVSRLPSGFFPGALVTPDGTWFDLLDYGWRMKDVDSPTNKSAMARWKAKVIELLEIHGGSVAVEFDTHS